MNYIILGYFIVINIIAMIVTAFDKYRAVHQGWRVKESTLLLIVAFGGSPAMLLTMLLIRHKTRHIKFMLGIPLIMIVQAAVVFLIWRVLHA